MRARRSIVWAAGLLALLASASTGRADQVVLTNGNVVEGEATVAEDGTVTVVRAGATLTFEPGQVRHVAQGDPAPEPQAPAADERVEAVVIPLTGAFEHQRSLQEFDRVIEEARRLSPRIVLFEVSSPGGKVAIGRHFARRVLEVTEARTVAYVNGRSGGAFSAAALFALSCNEIFMAPGQGIGAAVPYRPGPAGAPQAVSAKFLSKWKADFRALAERNGHPTAVADAMVGTEDGLAEVVVGEERAYVPARGLKPGGEGGARVRVICAPGEVLTLTAEEAVRCRLARAVVPDAARLLAGYRVARARVRVLDDPLQVAREAIGREQARLDEDLRELTRFTRTLLQENPSNYRYEVDPATGEFKDGGRAWRRRTRECLRNVKRSYEKIEEVQARLKREPDLTANVRWIHSLRQDLQSFEADLQRCRQLRSPPAPARR